MKTNVEQFSEAVKFIQDSLAKKLVVDKHGSIIHHFLMNSYGPQEMHTDSDGDWQGGYTKLDLTVRDLATVYRAELDAVNKEKERAQKELDAALKRKTDLAKREEEIYNKLAGVNGL